MEEFTFQGGAESNSGTHRDSHYRTFAFGVLIALVLVENLSIEEQLLLADILYLIADVILFLNTQNITENEINKKTAERSNEEKMQSQIDALNQQMKEMEKKMKKKIEKKMKKKDEKKE